MQCSEQVTTSTRVSYIYFKYLRPGLGVHLILAVLCVVFDICVRILSNVQFRFAIYTHTWFHCYDVCNFTLKHLFLKKTMHQFTFVHVLYLG